MSLKELPVEILDVIIGLLARNDLKQLRLLCRSVEPIAKRSIFSTLILESSDTYVRKWNLIAGIPELNKLVRTVLIRSWPGGWIKSWGFEPSEEYFEAMRCLFRFPSIQVVEFESWNQCCETFQESENEDLVYRRRMQKKLFKTLALYKAKTGRSIRALRFHNLQNIVSDVITNSDTFKQTLLSLTELQLFVLIEESPNTPRNEMSNPVVHEFWHKFRLKWLDPICSTLTSLKLGSSAYWGATPVLDLNGLHLPRLKTLVLADYVFAYDEQLAWILDHPTLESLNLYGCFILHHLDLLDKYLIEWHIDVTRFKKSTRFPHGRIVLQYDGRWGQYFDAIRANLHNLKQFGVEWEPPAPPMIRSYRNYEEMNTSFSHKRYGMLTAFGGYPWHEPKEGGSYLDLDAERIENVVKASEDDDRRGLNALLRVVRNRT